MPNTREKLIDLITDKENDLARKQAWFTDTYRIKVVADHLIANGVIFDKDINAPIKCQNCTHHDTDTCPENRVWCKMLRRYMKPDGYCSFGKMVDPK